MPQSYPTLGARELSIYTMTPILYLLRGIGGGNGGGVLHLHLELSWSKKVFRQKKCI
jgi:hypothetical protein